MNKISQGAPTPSLIIGMPGGFINVVESKRNLATLDIPQIRIDGNKDNGANWYTVSANSTATYYASFVRYANGSSTYFDVLAYQNVGSGTPTVKSTTQCNFFGWRVA